ncbi:MAG TPA: DsbA family oxidoreductase [Rhodanobacteraceae bacterium]|nr:DsbA family oxidoreductase [Rhodanobacteraceae bacterium]
MSAVPLRIDFVSDIACPWCAIGLASLRQALHTLKDELQAEIHLQPFQLDPQLPPEGEDAGERLMRKYGIGEAQLKANRKHIRERAAALGITIQHREGDRAWNTFDAHRLLHWAGLQDADKALELKQSLFHAYFADNHNVSDPAVLLRIVSAVGLDVDAARRVLQGDEYADAVRTREQSYQQAGVHSVPATIVNGKWLISGGQPPTAFEDALRDIAAKATAG